MRTHDEYKALVESRMNELLPELAEAFEKNEMPALMSESMRYSLNAGGKRLRPCMLLASCEMLGGNAEEALDLACAIEMIHTYSLIHDDLPGMDNDTLRRGRPTNHVVYGVGQAILAGDGLLNYAFEVMLKSALQRGKNIEAYVKAINAIAVGAGVKGMIAGQCADLYAERTSAGGEALLDYIIAGKTMSMFKGAVLAGAYIANAGEAEISALTAYVEAFGRLFQVTDDILDITADEAGFGKTKGKDAEAGKLTAVSTFTLEGADKYAQELRDTSLEALKDFGAEADYFRTLVINMYLRKH